MMGEIAFLVFVVLLWVGVVWHDRRITRTPEPPCIDEDTVLTEFPRSTLACFLRVRRALRDVGRELVKAWRDSLKL